MNADSKRPPGWNAGRTLRRMQAEQCDAGPGVERDEAGRRLPPPWAKAIWECFGAWRMADNAADEDAEVAIMRALAERIAAKARETDKP